MIYKQKEVNASSKVRVIFEMYLKKYRFMRWRTEGIVE